MGGWGAIPADNSPTQQKTPLTPPPPPHPRVLILALWVFFSRISEFRESAVWHWGGGGRRGSCERALPHGCVLSSLTRLPPYPAAAVLFCF